MTPPPPMTSLDFGPEPLFDAISKVMDTTKLQYVIGLERQVAEANWKLAMIQQAVGDFDGDKTP